MTNRRQTRPGCLLGDGRNGRHAFRWKLVSGPRRPTSLGRAALAFSARLLLADVSVFPLVLHLGDGHV